MTIPDRQPPPMDHYEEPDPEIEALFGTPFDQLRAKDGRVDPSGGDDEEPEGENE